ncbi:ZN143 protein, partial [Pomatorhinus ruficollis]|nr:ZN143 protein [Pomatorhinus ruficollis]
ERPFKCPFVGCGRSFTTSNIRKVHIRTHTGERPYMCAEPGCGRGFTSATNYKNHMRIHTGRREPAAGSLVGLEWAF